MVHTRKIIANGKRSFFFLNARRRVMPDTKSLAPTLKRAVENSILHVRGTKLLRVVLVWRGYLEALREFHILSDDEHAAIAELLPQLWNDPLAEGWKESGWLDSFADPEADAVV